MIITKARAFAPVAAIAAILVVAGCARGEAATQEPTKSPSQTVNCETANQRDWAKHCATEGDYGDEGETETQNADKDVAKGERAATYAETTLQVRLVKLAVRDRSGSGNNYGAGDDMNIKPNEVPVTVTLRFKNTGKQAVDLSDMVEMQNAQLLYGVNRYEGDPDPGQTDSDGFQSQLPRQLMPGTHATMTESFDVPKKQLKHLTVQMVDDPSITFTHAEAALTK